MIKRERHSDFGRIGRQLKQLPGNPMFDPASKRKVVLITGASSGLGRAAAERLAGRGHTVFGTSRHPSGDLGKVQMISLDVTNDESVENALRNVMAKAGRIDVLVNNAGSGLCGAVEDTSIEEAHLQMEINFFGPARMIRAVLPQMRRQGGGRIITVSSLAGLAALPFQAYYSATKFALEAFNEALRLELIGSNIESTTICPGDFVTGFTDSRRIAKAAYPDVHQRQFRTTLAIYERNEREGADPRHMAKMVERLVNRPDVGVRYMVGDIRQRFGIALKRILPANVFERILRAVYAIR